MMRRILPLPMCRKQINIYPVNTDQDGILHPYKWFRASWGMTNKLFIEENDYFYVTTTIFLGVLCAKLCVLCGAKNTEPQRAPRKITHTHTSHLNTVNVYKPRITLNNNN